jgi:hypothetical protein
MCDSVRVTHARLMESRGAMTAAVQLTELHVSFWNFSLTPGYVEIISECLVCAECGLVWTSVRDANKVRTHISELGSQELKDRILGPGSALPRAAEPPLAGADDLPRPSAEELID